jgi:sugar/nucleoside kinase (ribokinase family)
MFPCDLFIKRMTTDAYRCLQMSQKLEFDLVTVGHFAIDTIGTPRTSQPRQALGGSSTYVSVAAARLGARVSVVSKVGADFPKEYVKWLEANGVDLSGLKTVRSAKTTRFALDYGGSWGRRLRLEGRAPSIVVADVPLGLRAKTVHVAPIAGEMGHDVILKLRRVCEVLSLDPQGFVRSFDEKGRVGLKRWNDSDVFSRVDVFKSAVRELEVMTGERQVKKAVLKVAGCGVKVVIVTRGLRGSTLYCDGEFYDIPAYELRVVVDPTGAGDSFVGGFLAEYLKNDDPVWCCCVGSAAASFVVEGFGPERFGECHEVYERAHQIYRKVTR